MSSIGDRLSAASGSDRDRRTRGTVYLVGAGPGDPGLLTRKAGRLLRLADVVVHDALVGQGILDLVGPHAQLVDVGKRCGGRQTSQARINELLIEAGRSARTTVRLKGGDPFVFGRGGEEALALAEAGVRFEVVPGVTAAVGVSAYAGIPLTHRDLASSVTFVTGHAGRGEATRVDWEAIARLGGTLAIYMGVGTLHSTVDALIRAGRSGDTPAAVIEWGTHSRQRTVSGTLAELTELVTMNGIGAPALVVIGEVVAQRERMNWFERYPLRGRRIVVARSRSQPSRISAALRRRGAEVSELPRLRSKPVGASEAVDRALDDLGEYMWLLFTSPVAVTHFWSALNARGVDVRRLAGVRIAALGKATIDTLQSRGVIPDVALRTYDPRTVLEALKSGFGEIKRILFPREASMVSPLARECVAAGLDLTELEVFTVVSEDSPGTGADQLLMEADLVVLPSSTSARLLASTLSSGELATLKARVVAIGPSTAQTALACGLAVHAVAGEHTVRGVVDAVAQLAVENGAVAERTELSDLCPSEPLHLVHGSDR